MALAGAKLFVEEGAHVFISGRRQDALDEAVKLIGRNVTGVQADSTNLDDLDRLFDAVRREKGAVDVLWTSAGTGEERKLGEITEQHFDATFGLNARGTLFTVQKALKLFNDGGSIFMTGSIGRIVEAAHASGSTQQPRHDVEGNVRGMRFAEGGEHLDTPGCCHCGDLARQTALADAR